MIGTILNDTYQVERPLGSGNMGVVYVVQHLRLGRRFALKLLQGKLSARADSRARFRREAQVTSQLQHPHLVQVVDYNVTDEGLPYLVMELLEGEVLRQRLDRVGKLSLEQTRALLEQVTAALIAAHEHGVVHRDLKPSNVILCQDHSGKDQVKILDFGVAKVTGLINQITRTNATIGTPRYMAPEQAAGRTREVDHRADIYTVGAMTYEMLSGQPCVTCGTVRELLDNVLSGRHTPLTSLCDELPPAVSAVIDKALAKKPEHRWSTMSELWRAFSNAADGRPIALPTAAVDPTLDLERAPSRQAAATHSLATDGQPASGGAVAGRFAVLSPDPTAALSAADPTAALSASDPTASPPASASDGDATLRLAPDVGHGPARGAASHAPVAFEETALATALDDSDQAKTREHLAPTGRQGGLRRSSRSAWASLGVGAVVLAGGVVAAFWIAGTGPAPIHSSRTTQRHWPRAPRSLATAPSVADSRPLQLDAGGPDATRGPDATGPTRTASRPQTSTDAATGAVDAGRRWRSRRPRRTKRRRQPNRPAILQVMTLSDDKPLWAEVFLDGRRVGRSPLRLEARPGRHLLSVRRAGFERRNRRLRLSSGQRATVRFDLERQTVSR